MKEVTTVKELMNELSVMKETSHLIDGSNDFYDMKIICRDPNCRAYNKFVPHIATCNNKKILVFDLINEE